MPSTPSRTLQDGLLQAANQSRARTAQQLLGRFVQADQYVGEVVSPGYDEMLIQVHDHYRKKAGGIPSLGLLVATRLAPDADFDPADEDSTVILLRAMDGAPLPNQGEKENIRVQTAQQVTGEKQHWDEAGVMDFHTAHELSYAGMKCTVLGTFYVVEAEPGRLELRFGADIANFYPNRGLKVYKPVGAALDAIVNYTPETNAATTTFDVGTVRYASTRRATPGVDDVKVRINPTDLISQKTALFGMTRTGKSNTTKILIESVFDLRFGPAERRVGQLVLDPDGEYSNPNPQDGVPIRKIAEVRKDGDVADIVTYGLTPKANDPSRKMLRLNFFDETLAPLGKSIIDSKITENSGYLKAFRGVSLEAPDPQDRGEVTRHKRRLLVYRTLLAQAGYSVPAGLLPQTQSLFNANLIQALQAGGGKDPNGYMSAGTILANGNQSWSQLFIAFSKLAGFIEDKTSGYNAFEQNYIQTSSSGEQWCDPDLGSLLTMCRHTNGVRLMGQAKAFHEPGLKGDYADDIYTDLSAGRLVILDQSAGDSELNKAASTRIMQKIFTSNFTAFTSDQPVPEILVYVEEAHNILPRANEEDMTDIWVRTAKEGAKVHIGLIYSTQEVTSIQKNILKNTANWFIGHLNNADETKEISKFSDFKDFEPSIRRASDKGFLRVKTLSNAFVVPVQVRKFEVSDAL